MRAVIIGTDFMKDTDGSFKALETNTNIQLDTQWSYNFDSGSFEQFVLSNNFNEIVLISNENQLSNQSSYTLNYDFEYIGDIAQNVPIEEQNDFKIHLNFKSYLTSFTTGSGITFNSFTTDETAVSIPFVEDSDNKLIIRLSYDTTALIDDIYARDNWEFLKLMYDGDPSSIPGCYINDVELGFDSIGTTLRDNGNHPNYCVKKRVTPSNNIIYPKLYKISTIEELEDIKANLQIDEYIQEFIYNTDDLLDNRIKSYRSVDLIYGSNLDIINLQVLEKTTNLEIVESADFDDNNEVQYWDRMRYSQKFYTQISDIAIKLDSTENTKIILPNGDISLAKNLEIGDSVKSIIFNTLPTDNIFGNNTAELWSASFNDTIADYSISSSILRNEESLDYFGAIVTFETDTNSTFSDINHATIMVKDGDDAKFKTYYNLKIGDTIVLFDIETDSVITSNITNIYYKYDKFIGYTLDFEESDLFLTLEETENQNRYGLVTHNYTYDCRRYTCPQVNWFTIFQYTDCGSGAYQDLGAYGFQSLPTNVCARMTGYSVYCESFYEGGTTFPLQIGAYCNDQKSDIFYKENLLLIGKSPSNINIYQFNYKGEDGLYVGVIAQELIGTPYETALSKNEDNLYVVDYNKIDVEFKKIK
jgi:hypothetical protein